MRNTFGLAALLLIAACGGCSDNAPTAEAPVQDDIGAVDSLSPDGEGGDAVVPTGPPCIDDGDCEAVFFTLGECRVARCGAPLADGQTYCQKADKDDGVPCDDGLVCTLEASCDAGACVRQNEVECPDPPPCRVSEGCESDCSEAPAENGSACSLDGDVNTKEQCVDGLCVAQSQVPCTVDSDCPDPGACAGQMSCQAGLCKLLPPGGMVCPPVPAGTCLIALECIEGVCPSGVKENGDTCDDGNPCTIGDACAGGACAGSENTCVCSYDGDCAAFEDDDLCNGTLRCGDGLCEVDPGTVVSCAEAESPCHQATCEPDSGLCKVEPHPDGVTCDDGNACTLGDSCQKGECTPAAAALCGLPADCGGEDCAPECWKPFDCDPGLGCIEQPNDGIGCDDGDPCNLQDVCLLGACTAGPAQKVCDDGNPCTQDLCNPEAQTGCVFAPDPAGECDDGDPCTVLDHCEAGQCVPEGALECEDGNPCTTGICVGGSGCEFFNNGEPCEDGDPCTDGDKCQQGKCKPGGKVCPCNEDANCTAFGAGTCDGSWHCIANQCVLETAAATGCTPAAEPCLATFCDPATGTCKTDPVPDGIPCGVLDPCTLGAVCLAGACTGGIQTTCDDGNDCTDDECVPGKGCAYLANANTCDDADPCTVADGCVAGTCVGSQSVCECVADSDCPQPANACDGKIRCVANECALDPNTKVLCNSVGLGPCLSASCNPETGQCNVALKADGVSCDDQDECTAIESCLGGNCVPLAETQCDDANPCTDDLCTPDQGCTHANNQSSCNDGNPCTADEACAGGTCQGGYSVCVEVCAGGVDDDLDGLVDCDDPECAQLPECDACATAVFVQCGSAGVPGAVGDTGASNVGDTACGSGLLPDRIYRFTTTASGPVAMTLLQGAQSFTLRVLTSGVGGGCDASGCKASGSEATFDAVAGQVYHVVVEKLFLGSSPNFVLSVTCTNQCVPACASVECGPDGCGGSCGTCDDGNPCTLDVCEGGVCAAVPIVTCCQNADDCSDGDVCTTDACLDGQCTYEPGEASCCSAAADCDDGVPCTSDQCVGNECVHDAPTGCCSADTECEDDDPCTTDLCVTGKCVVVEKPDCCTSVADCDQGATCKTVGCIGNVCLQSDIPGCCTNSADCADGDPCTHDGCNIALQECAHSTIPGCCATAADCGSPPSPCVKPVCVSGTCSKTTLDLCCETAAQCPAAQVCEAVSCEANLCVVTPQPGCCQSAGDCNDDNPCTQDQCALVGSVGQCVHGTQVGCCQLDLECDDGDPCTESVCDQGKCEHLDLPGCCQLNAECDDGLRCTLDICDGGECAHSQIPACCQNAFDCAVGACISASCGPGGFCAYEPKPGCCQSDQDCFTGNPCAKATCVSGICNVTEKPDCCLTDDVCTSSDPCAPKLCKANKCVGQPLAGCCTQDADCPQSSAACSTTRCLGHACVTTSADGCCENDADCPGAGPCQTASCASGSCVSQPIAGCCSDAADCPVPESPCLERVCEDSVCTEVSKPACCVDAVDCDSAGLCDVVDCVLGQCVTTGTAPGCCTTPLDCGPASAPCQQAGCVDNSCVVSALTGCCEQDSDCQAPASLEPCAVAACVSGGCALAFIDGCCASNDDCPDDGHACTTVSCVQGACVSEPEDGCCLQDAECASLDGDCTSGVCTAGVCVEAATPGCCLSSETCPDDNDPCTQPTCSAGSCYLVPLQGCCVEDPDCPEDADPCVQAKCAAEASPGGEGSPGTCTWNALPGCCASAADCPPHADSCVVSVCQSGQCGTEIVPACPAGACFYDGADDLLDVLVAGSSDGVQWAVGTDAPFAGSGAAIVEVGAGAIGAYADLIFPPAVILGQATLRFAYRLDVAAGDCTAGGLHALVSKGADEPQVVWSTCLNAGWQHAVVDLSAWTGETITVRIRLETGQGVASVAAAVDDMALTGSCARTCEPGCGDGNPCTADSCFEGLCEATPVAGCCLVDQACADADPCTLDACGPTGACVQQLQPGCVQGACFAEDFSDSLPAGSTPLASGANQVFVSDSGSFSEGGHLVLSAAEPGTAELQLAPIVPAGGALTLAFALRQSVGLQCELGQVALVVDGVVLPLECGIHDWQPVLVPIPTENQIATTIALRLNAAASGAKVEIDDLRVVGACHATTCGAEIGCDDGLGCTLDYCGPGFDCLHVPLSSCCDSDADCGDMLGCEIATCENGVCEIEPGPGCAAGACWFEGFDSGQSALAVGSASVPGLQLGWELSELAAWSAPSALHGSYQTLNEAVGSRRLVAPLPSLLVGSADTRLTWRFRQSLSGPSCAQGALELWIGNQLVWLSCGNVDEWVTAEVALGPWVGSVVSAEFRLRSDPALNASGHVFIDDLAAFGTCAPVGCANSGDCADANPCTDEACLGFNCVYSTNDAACDDGDACTTGDACSGGGCTAQPLNCDDGEPCTDDYCDNAKGCVFVSNAVPCDDQDPCTAGDSCSGGGCVGTPILCKDFNGCTQDGCTPGLGCQFEPEPFGTPCADDGAQLGVCWDGQCVDWQLGVSEIPPATATDTRAYSVLRRDGPTPLFVAGVHDPQGTPQAAVFRVDQNSLALKLVSEDATVVRWLGVSEALVVGEDGAVGPTTPALKAPELDVPPGLDLYAVDSTGATFLLGGDGSSFAPVRSTVRRCQAIGSGWAACSVMPIVRSPDKCGKQVPFHVRRFWTGGNQLTLVAGASVEGSDWVARVAVWDGNTLSDCQALGVYSGEVYYDDPGSAHTMAVNALPGGSVEIFNAIDGVSNGDVWAGGSSGMIYHFNGVDWQQHHPQKFAQAASWGAQHTVRGLVRAGDELHVVGDGVGVDTGGCRQGFYLHARRVDKAWVFDRLAHFGAPLMDCGKSPFDHMAFNDVTVDALTGDLYIVGWAPDVAGKPTERRGLVMRLQKP